MTAHRGLLIVSAVLVVASAGCTPARSSTSGSATTTTAPSAAASAVETTASSGAGPVEVAPSGSVHTPAVGSPERTALMDAARAYLGLPASDKFVVYQLKSDGAWAVGELNQGGTTRFHAFRNEAEGGWKGIWSGPAGTSAGATQADERFAIAVISAIDWTGRPSDAEMVAAATRLAKQSGAIQVVGAKFGDATQDSKGRWWAEVDILNDLDGAIVVIYRDGGVWKLFDAGTGLEPSDLPADVKLKF